MGHRVPVPQELDNSLGCQLRELENSDGSGQSRSQSDRNRNKKLKVQKELALDRGCLNNDLLLRRAKQRLVVAGGVKASC